MEHVITIVILVLVYKIIKELKKKTNRPLVATEGDYTTYRLTR